MSWAELAKDGEDFASDISFKAADNLGLAHSFPGAASHVCLGPLVITKPDHNDAMKSGIGLAVTTAVEPMPVGLAGRSRYRIDPAERCEGNSALYRIVVVRLRYDQRTKAYMQRRTKEGMSKTEVIRCLKRYVAREVFASLRELGPKQL